MNPGINYQKNLGTIIGKKNYAELKQPSATADCNKKFAEVPEIRTYIKDQ